MFEFRLDSLRSRSRYERRDNLIRISDKKKFEHFFNESSSNCEKQSDCETKTITTTTTEIVSN